MSAVVISRLMWVRGRYFPQLMSCLELVAAPDYSVNTIRRDKCRGDSITWPTKSPEAIRAEREEMVQKIMAGGCDE